MNGETTKFDFLRDRKEKPRDIILSVCSAMEEKGYDPIGQIVGYILSGDPTYITGYKGARNSIRKLERDELLEELVKFYLEKNGQL
ncbi:MAG TPA: IreB family regulatory phosphoprotein [Clostridiales bacterium]|nr:IreB family regulatory phosphoprotein [Clostridiales bacterium]